jgi:hypothetical protein
MQILGTTIGKSYFDELKTFSSVSIYPPNIGSDQNEYISASILSYCL